MLRNVFAAACVFGLVLSIAAGPAADTGTKAEIGKPAPAFTLKDTAGNEHSLEKYKGKIVVLQWTNHECPFIVARAGKDKALNVTAASFKAEEVVWLAIDSSHFCETKREQIAAFDKASGFAFPTLLDAEGKIGRAYGAKTTPHMFVIGKDGNLAYSGALDDDKTGTNKNARNYVREAVDALLKGSAVSTTTSTPYGCSVKYKG